MVRKSSMGEEEHIGRRIAHWRKVRGLTQTGLAEKANVSRSLIAQVESGHKPATASLNAAVARALNLDITELTGQPYRGNTERTDRIHASIPQIRQALVYWDVPPDLECPPRRLDVLRGDVGKATELRQSAHYVELGAMLPALIKELTYVVHAATGRERVEAFRLLASVYSAADSMAYKLGYLDLFHLAVERVAWAASHAEDPLLGPVTDTRRSMAFLATGAWDGGLKLLDRTSMHMEAGLRDNSAMLSVYGTVHLRAAIMAARGSRPSVAWDHIENARETAQRLGRDTNDYALLFGPSNVAIHEVAVAVELGDADEAIRRGEGLQLPATLSAERSSHHYIDLSRAWLWAGDRDKALSCLLTAESLAPQRTWYHPMARETVMQLDRAYRTLPQTLRSLEGRMGV
ncbi:helix-turn-helix domain-containing protein [Nonomuraea phyllanthi]|uniref:helix-turn-helix domain-containing protein n=1 Tax=Nonomuraea phyllanthi TaxID=2219224 RepID=UPI0012932610|nr:helix-turn-helix transcriptional regulator [Nonomuraea phyllanthi]QFY06152.1 helix-turn-helix domain-containing protein [Nonomuraea phyllanthi]